MPCDAPRPVRLLARFRTGCPAPLVALALGRLAARVSQEQQVAGWLELAALVFPNLPAVPPVGFEGAVAERLPGTGRRVLVGWHSHTDCRNAPRSSEERRIGSSALAVTGLSRQMLRTWGRTLRWRTAPPGIVDNC